MVYQAGQKRGLKSYVKNYFKKLVKKSFKCISYLCFYQLWRRNIVVVPVHPVSPGLTTHIKPYPGLKSVSNLIYRFKTSIQTTPCLRECLMPVCKNHFEKKKDFRYMVTHKKWNFRDDCMVSNSFWKARIYEVFKRRK